MHRAFASFLWVFLALFLSVSLPAYSQTTYYVDATNGNNSWSGTLPDTQGDDGPWKSIATVNAKPLSAGDAVLFKCGETWRESLVASSAGVPGNPITYGAYGANCDTTNKPVINAAQVVSGWSQYSVNIYAAHVEAQVQQVIVDRKQVSLAHYPNKGYLSQNPTSLFLTIDADSTVTPNNYLVDAALQELAGKELIGATAHIRTMNWVIEDCTITGFNGADQISWGKCPTTGQSTLSGTDFPIKKGWGYYLSNKFWMLDEPWEWYYESSSQTLYLRLPDNDSPATYTIEASHLDSGVSVTNPGSITVDGLSIKNAGKYGINLNKPTEFLLRNLEITNSGDTGVLINNAGGNATATGTIDANVMRSSVRQGINLVNFNNAVITNNTVEDTGNIGTPRNSLAAIRANDKSDNAIISNNIVRRTGYNGIRFNKNSHIRNNVVENTCLVLDDCGAIYTWNGRSSDYFYADGTPKTNTPPTVNGQVIGNIVRDANPLRNIDGSAYTVTSSQGIYLDNFANGVEVSGNTVINTDVGIYMNDPFNNNIHDNTVYGARAAQVSMNEYSPIAQGTVHGNDIRSNILFPLSAVPSMNIFGVFDDTTHFGTFDSNLYSGLYSSFIAKERYKPSVVSVRNYDLAAWQQIRGSDVNGRIYEPFAIAPYKSLQVLQNVTIPNLNGTFDASNSISSWSFWPNVSPTPTQWLSGCGLDGGCLFLFQNATDSYNANSPLFSLVKDKYYRLSFSAIAPSGTTNRQMGRALVKIAGYMTSVGLDAPILVGAERKEYQFVFRALTSLNNAKIDFEVNIWNSIYFDNVRLEEVTAEVNDPSDDAYILTNETNVEQIKSCPADIDITRCGEYVDLDGKPVVWGTDQVRLPPYSSKIVVWTNNPFRDDDRDGIANSDDHCLDTAVGVWVNDEGCSAYQQVPADLTVAISGTPDPVDVNGQMTYSVTVANTGPSDATGITVSDPLPAGMNFVSASAGCTGGATVTCNIGNLASGASATLNITVSPTVAGNIANTITVTGVDYDPDITNNSASSSSNVQAVLSISKTGSGTVTGIPGPINCGPACSGSYDANTVVTLTAIPDATTDFGGWTGCDTVTGTNCTVSMSASKSVIASFTTKSTDLSVSITAPATVNQGQPVPYTVIVTNAGPSTASGIALSGLTGCNLPATTLASGANMSCTATATASTVGNLPQTVNITGTETDPNPANNSATAVTTVNATADLSLTSLTATASGTNLLINDQVSNIGTGNAGSFNISYYLSSNSTYEAGTDTYLCNRSITSLAGGAADPATGTVQTTCPIPSVAGGSYYVIAIADLNSSVAESNESNNMTAAQVSISGKDILPVELSATQSGTNQVLVTDTVTNQGNSGVYSFPIRFYLSTNQTYEQGIDIPLVSLYGGTCRRETNVQLWQGATNRSVDLVCNKPASAVAGVDYYVLAVDDWDGGSGLVAEYNETNNVMATAGTIRW